MGETALYSAGLVHGGLTTLGEGAVVAGMVLGAIVAVVLERRFWASAVGAGVGAVLAFIGLIHAPQVQWAAAPGVALGYAMPGVLLVGFAAWTGARPGAIAPADAQTDQPVDQH